MRCREPGHCVQVAIARSRWSGRCAWVARRYPVLTCPYCKQLAMTLLRKCILSPDSVVVCASCGRKVGVPWLAIGAAVPVALGIVAAVKLAVPWSFAGAVGGLIAYVGIQRFVVPVVGRDG